MAPKNSEKKSKSRRTGRVLSRKLDELYELYLKQSHDLRKMRNQMKKKDRQILQVLSLLEELRNRPVLPSADFQASCSCRSSLNQAESSGLRRLQLSFVCKLPTKLFTANIIYAIDDGTETNVPVRIVLLDEGNNVVNEGPLSSLKVEIFVAHGDFKAEESEGWTGKEFETCRVPARQQKGALLLGNCVGILENGSFTFNDLKFVDNSSWVPSKTFRLVAKVAESARVPGLDMVEIRPAISTPFPVNDQRGKQYEKHHVPSRDDEVWRIRRIGRDGPYHKRLEKGGVRTVEDFMQMYYTDKSSLREILGAKDGAWTTIVEHAKECSPNNEGFHYDASESKVQLLFDCFYKLVGVSFDDQNCRRLQDLTEDDNSRVEQLRQRALDDRTKLVRINSLSGWKSAKTNTGIVPNQNPQDPVDPPPHQVGLTMNELLSGFESVPQSPIWNIAEGMDRLEGPETQKECGYFDSVESVLAEYQLLPGFES